MITLKRLYFMKSELDKILLKNRGLNNINEEKKVCSKYIDLCCWVRQYWSFRYILSLSAPGFL